MNHAVAHKRLVASRILPGVDAAMSGWPQGGVRGQRARLDLSGTWERHVNGKFLDSISVPSSQRPLGYYRLKREFLLPALSGWAKRLFLWVTRWWGSAARG